MEFKGEYKVTKIGVKDETAFRFIEPGFTVKGEVFIQPTIAGGKSLIVSGQGFSNQLRTSAVLDIKDQENGNFLVETVNSIYSVEKVADVEKE